MFPIKLRPNKTTHKNSIEQKIKNTRRTNTKKYENLSVFEFIYCGKKIWRGLFYCCVQRNGKSYTERWDGGEIELNRVGSVSFRLLRVLPCIRSDRKYRASIGITNGRTGSRTADVNELRLHHRIKSSQSTGIHSSTVYISLSIMKLVNNYLIFHNMCPHQAFKSFIISFS